MLPSIGFDDESRLEANKIHNEWPERLLPTKLESAQSAIAQ
jgi:hypothetical protein